MALNKKMVCAFFPIQDQKDSLIKYSILDLTILVDLSQLTLGLEALQTNITIKQLTTITKEVKLNAQKTNAVGS